jgi:hypothetical protein
MLQLQVWKAAEDMPGFALSLNLMVDLYLMNKALPASF